MHEGPEDAGDVLGGTQGIGLGAEFTTVEHSIGRDSIAGAVDVAVPDIDATWNGCVKAEAGVSGLVDVEEVGAVVPGPRVVGGGSGVGVDSAGTVVTKSLVDGRGTRAAVDPESKGVSLGLVAGLEEPEEDVLLKGELRGCWNGDCAGVGFEAGFGLAEVGDLRVVSRGGHVVG